MIDFKALASKPLTKHEQFMFELEQMNIAHDTVMGEFMQEFKGLERSIEDLKNSLDDRDD